PAPRPDVLVGRELESGASEGSADGLVPTGTKPDGFHSQTARHCLLVDLVDQEHLAGVPPQAVDSGLHAPMALVGPVAQAYQPRLGMTEVIARLLDRLLGDPGQLGVGGR